MCVSRKYLLNKVLCNVLMIFILILLSIKCQYVGWNKEAIYSYHILKLVLLNIRCLEREAAMTAQNYTLVRFRIRSSLYWTPQRTLPLFRKEYPNQFGDNAVFALLPFIFHISDLYTTKRTLPTNKKVTSTLCARIL